MLFRSGVKRLLAAENFFFSTYSTTDGQAAEVGLAPVHQGEVREIPVDDTTPWICAGGSYLGSDDSILMETQFQGLKGLFTGEAVFFLRASGHGSLIVSAFGRIEEIEIDGSLTVDTGHLVAFEETLRYTVSKAGGSWIQSWLAGEGITMRFEGVGKILVQSHNPNDYGRMLGALLPPREN